MAGTATISWISETAVNGYYRTLTLDQPASDLTNFPVLFTGTFTYLKTIANGGKVNNANGYDIVFYSDVTLTTKLKFERVNWDATTGTVEFWVKVPTLTSASALVIYLAYGNPNISTDQQDAVNTWNSNYAAVWHVKDGTTLSLLDSTTNANNGTNNGLTATTGKIDGGVADNASSYADINGSASVQITVMTLAAWVNPNAVASYKSIYGWADYSGGGGNAGGPQLRANNLNPGKLEFLVQDVALIATSTGTVANSAWSHVAVTYDSSGNWVFYINGTTSGSGTNLQSFSYFNSQLHLWIGGRGNGTTPSPIEEWDGSMDELRYMNAVMNATWIATEYSNQNDPANFYIIGSETPA